MDYRLSWGVYENADLPSLTSVLYIGDIPDSAIDRIKVAGDYLSYFTIHSAETLKVARQALIDPVVIGWKDPPAILVDKKAQFKRCSKYCEGVVIAIWDKEKELDIL